MSENKFGASSSLLSSDELSLLFSKSELSDSALSWSIIVLFSLEFSSIELSTLELVTSSAFASITSTPSWSVSSSSNFETFATDAIES